MKRPNIIGILFLCPLIAILMGLMGACTKESITSVDLSGEWMFRIDSLDQGIQEEWHNQKLAEVVTLPGSMAENRKGEDITVNTKWTGDIVDRSYFTDDRYARYRQPGNVKVPFWLQPDKHYIGAAWYQKEVLLPKGWVGKYIELVLERPHWETQVWVNEMKVGLQNTLATPHVYDLTNVVKQGKNRISIRVDNRIKEVNPGVNAHSISDHTQSNWNGIAGTLQMNARPMVFIDDVRIFPDTNRREVLVKVKLRNRTGSVNKALLLLELFESESGEMPSEAMRFMEEEIEVEDDISLELDFPMGDAPKPWDEFHPNVYTMRLVLESMEGTDRRHVNFGMREFRADGSRFSVNGRPVFLRGTLECAIFPKTGYPSTNVEEWKRIFTACKAHGLNHMRFHSWCPPEAAFDAADHVGIYLHVECSSWANQGSSIGDGKPIDAWLYKEAEHILKAYGNHPSFCMMAYGNEPAGPNQKEWLADFLEHWRSQDQRRVYTGAAAWPYIESADYYLAPQARIQGWGQELNSIINKEAPKTSYDWEEIIRTVDMPYVSHEIGQWCVYPSFREISKYTGVLKPRNFEIFKESLEENHMGQLADSFLLASGKLQALCYKADIEAALRTRGFAGFELLDLHDFPGQGTALVGVLDPFWEEKGYISPQEFSRFCNQTVPLARLSKRIFMDNETIRAGIEVAHFGDSGLDQVTPSWELNTIDGNIIAEGHFTEINIPIDNGIALGDITIDPVKLDSPRKLTLTVYVAGFANSWDIWIYPSEKKSTPGGDEVRVVRSLDPSTVSYLEGGGNVLLTPAKGSLKAEYGGDIGVGFSSIFWNTAWTNGQKPHTLGILCNPHHPALADFPTEFHSNWQWWDAMSHSNAINLDSFSPELRPIVRIIDDWFTNRRLALIFEAKVGNGKLIVTGVDLLSNPKERPEAEQLLYSLRRYMTSDAFDPEVELNAHEIQNMYK